MASTTVQKNMFDSSSNTQKNMFDSSSNVKNYQQVNNASGAKNYQQVNDASGAKNYKDVSTGVSTHYQINLSDFPGPSSMLLSKEQTRVIKESNLKSQVKTAIGCNTDLQVNERTEAFNHLADKERVASSLVCTKACRNVTTLNEKGEFGVCTREYCTFAHSEEELTLPWCTFDQTCRFKNGRFVNFNTNTLIPDSQCKFRHSDETIENYYRRSGKKRPYLPATSVNSRKPNKRIPTSTAPTQPCEHKPISASTAPTQPLKSRWEQTTTSTEFKKSDLKEKKYSRKRYDSYSESSSSEESSSSDSESESHRRSSSRHYRKRKSSSEKNTTEPQVIRVPNNELATVAIKAAFDRGQYNIRVVIEE